MKIAVDISQIVYQGSGVARYTQMLVNNLIKYDQKNQYIFLFSSLRQKLPKNIKSLITSSHRLVELKIPPTGLNFLWNKLHALPIEHFTGPVDIYISSDWAQSPSKAKKITIVHDLVYLKYPQTLPRLIVNTQKNRMKWIRKEVDLIIADSESTKNDLIELLSISKDKIKVIYPALTFKKQITKNLPTDKAGKIQTNNKYKINNKKYILSVGKLEPRKNISRLIQAFQQAKLKDIKLVIAGVEGWKAQDSSEVAELTPRKWRNQNIKFVGYIPDWQLYQLYKNALFFIYPSLYEGFGYPIVEAMSMGCPVATSNTSSLKEIVQHDGVLFDPVSINDITRAIIKLTNNQKLRFDLSKKGRLRAQDFNQKNFAHKLINTYQEI